MSIPAIIVALINYFLYKKKVVAETENIKANTKIAKEITYGQLQQEGKHKNIKSKIEIFRELNKLETEMRSKENKTTDEQKKLEALEMLKKEFKTSFTEKKLVAEPAKKLLISKKGSRLSKKKKNKEKKV